MIGLVLVAWLVVVAWCGSYTLRDIILRTLRNSRKGI